MLHVVPGFRYQSCSIGECMNKATTLNSSEPALFKRSDLAAALFLIPRKYPFSDANMV